jgi:hypothetical protein
MRYSHSLCVTISLFRVSYTNKLISRVPDKVTILLRCYEGFMESSSVFKIKIKIFRKLSLLLKMLEYSLLLH